MLVQHGGECKIFLYWIRHGMKIRHSVFRSSLSASLFIILIYSAVACELLMRYFLRALGYYGPFAFTIFAKCLYSLVIVKCLFTLLYNSIECLDSLESNGF